MLNAKYIVYNFNNTKLNEDLKSTTLDIIKKKNSIGLTPKENSTLKSYEYLENIRTKEYSLSIMLTDFLLDEYKLNLQQEFNFSKELIDAIDKAKDLDGRVKEETFKQIVDRFGEELQENVKNKAKQLSDRYNIKIGDVKNDLTTTFAIFESNVLTKETNLTAEVSTNPFVVVNWLDAFLSRDQIKVSIVKVITIHGKKDLDAFKNLNLYIEVNNRKYNIDIDLDRFVSN